MAIDPEDPSLARPLRIFVSHRWDDAEFHTRILSSFEDSGTSVVDVSLTREHEVVGPRGGSVSPLKIQLELASRIRTCDLFFVPADVAAGNEDWLQYETLKAAEYRKPAIFISDNWRRVRWNKHARQLLDEGLPTRTANLDSKEILEAAKSMLPNRLH